MELSEQVKEMREDATEANKVGWIVCTGRGGTVLKTTITQLLSKGLTHNCSFVPPAVAPCLHYDCLVLFTAVHTVFYSVTTKCFSDSSPLWREENGTAKVLTEPAANSTDSQLTGQYPFQVHLLCLGEYCVFSMRLNDHLNSLFPRSKVTCQAFRIL